MQPRPPFSPLSHLVKVPRVKESILRARHKHKHVHLGKVAQLRGVDFTHHEGVRTAPRLGDESPHTCRKKKREVARSTERRVSFQCEGVRVRFSMNVSGYSVSIFHVLSVEVFLMNLSGVQLSIFHVLNKY